MKDERGGRGEKHSAFSTHVRRGNLESLKEGESI